MTTPALADMPAPDFASRRKAVLAALGDGVLVLPAAPVQHASRDTERPYVPDRELLYLTGATEPETVAALIGGGEPRFVLFTRERDPAAELWAGPRLGPEASAERFGPDECHPVAELSQRLPDLLQSADRLYYRLGRGGPVEDLVLGALARARVRGARSGTGPRAVVDPGEILDQLRLIKDDSEVARLRRAAEISALGHRCGAAAICPGVGEWVVEAAIDGAFRAAGGRGPAYETIVGAGPNACVLHYVDNSAGIADGDLVLVDAGAEFGFYHGDITRTYPASGRFSELQRAVYRLVDGARAAGVAAVGPGATIADVHDVVVRALVDGLIELGAVDGGRDAAIESGAYKTFFPHQTSHWLGLDVHDVGDYARDGESRKLEPGMVFTVEPGLYFRPGGEKVPSHLDGIGIRVEDDVLVTETGCEVLTGGVPTDPEAIEALVGSAADA